MRMFLVATCVVLGTAMSPAFAQEMAEPVIVDRSDRSQETPHITDFWDGFVREEDGRRIITSPRWSLGGRWTLEGDDVEVDWPLSQDEYGVRAPYRYREGEADIALILKWHY